MSVETTCCIIKPDLYGSRGAWDVVDILTTNYGFDILRIKVMRMTSSKTQELYQEHVGKPFFEGLVEFMSNKPITVLVLSRDNAVAHLRQILGNTDPTKAAPGTLRYRYGSFLPMNALHGSDSLESAQREINFFFGKPASL